MRKLISVLTLSLILASTVFTGPIYAADNKTTLTPTDAITSPIPSEPTDSKPITDGYHVKILFPLGLDKEVVASHLVFYELALEDKDGNVIATGIANKENYSNGAFSVAFNVPSFNVGDEFNIRLTKAGKLAPSLTVGQKTHINVNQYAPLVVTVNNSGLDSPSQIHGTKDNPVVMAGVLPSDQAILKTLDVKGNPLPDVSLNVNDVGNNTSTVNKSNSNGLALIPINKNSGELELSLAKDYNGMTLLNSSDGVILKAVVFDGTTQYLDLILTSNGEAGVGNLTVKTTSNINSDINTTWSKFALQLKSNDGVQKLTGLMFGDVTLNAPSGKYEISAVDNLYTDIKLNQSSLSIADNGKASIQATATPKHTLKVVKSSDSKLQDYKFQVMNVPSAKEKTYSGKVGTVFAVAPGLAFQIKDLDTNKVLSVNIPPNEGEIIIDLNSGLISNSSGSNPYTGDPVYMTIVALTVSLILMIFATIALKKHKIATKSLMSIFLVTTMFFSSLGLTSPKIALADISGGVGGDVDGYKANAGQWQSFKSGMLRVYPVINSDSGLNLTYKGGSDTSLSDISKYSFDKFAFYIAPDSTVDSRWRKGSYLEIQAQTNNNIPGLDVGLGNYFDGQNGRESEDFRLNNRTLPYAGSNPSDLMNNKFYAKLSNSIKNYNFFYGTNGTSVTLGDSLHKAFDVDPKEKGEMLKAYKELLLTRLEGSPRLNDATIQALTNAINKQDGSVSLVFETLPGFYVMSPSYGEATAPSGMYLSVHTYLYLNALYGMGGPKIWDNLQYEALAIPSQIYACDSATKGNYDPRDIATNYIRFSGKYAMENYVKTLFPITDAIKKSGTNPFGGWGFMDYSNAQVEDSPGVWLQLNATEVDSEGKETGNKFTVYENGYTGWEKANTSSHQFKKMTSKDNKITGSGSFIFNNVKYYIMPDKDTHITVTDDKDNGILDKGFTSVSQKGFSIELGYDTSVTPTDLGEYLYQKEMRKDNYFTKLTGSSKPKYFDAGKDQDGIDIFGNAKVVLDVKVTSQPANAEGIVPQWRLSKYANEIIDSTDESLWRSALSWLTLNPDSTTDITSYISPSGNIAFNMVDPDLSNQPWFKSLAKPIIPNDTVRSITHSNPLASIPVFGDLLSIKENTTISNIKTADWVLDNPIIQSSLGIASTVQGDSTSATPLVTKTNIFKYGIDNPKNVVHYRAVSNDWADDYGSYCDCYLVKEDAPESTNTADYNVKVDFRRFIPLDTTSPKYEPVEVIKNGFASITAQSPISFKVNPEVPMLYSDNVGNDGVVFVAGDKLRTISPVSYHTLKYDAQVNPTVVPTAMATDARAQVLAANLGAGNKPVALKGSAANISFDVNGTLTTKSYILDIGPTAVKNTWNPGTTYNPVKLDEAFLSKFGSKDDSGKWVFNAKAMENLKINNVLFGNNVSDAPFTNTENKAKNYQLVVRGGKLLAVDGDYNYSSNLARTNPELLSALENMKLTTDDSVLSTFVSNAGDVLTEEQFADYANGVRGTLDIQVGKGWYREDTTVLIVREFTHTFKLPIVMASDKIPMSVGSILNTPIDKTQFYLSGAKGFTILRFGLWSNEASLSPYDNSAGQKEVYMQHDSSIGEFGKQELQFVVPNVTILDTAQ